VFLFGGEERKSFTDESSADVFERVCLDQGCLVRRDRDVWWGRELHVVVYRRELPVCAAFYGTRVVNMSTGVGYKYDVQKREQTNV
jgi:hypothetical protein